MIHYFKWYFKQYFKQLARKLGESKVLAESSEDLDSDLHIYMFWFHVCCCDELP